MKRILAILISLVLMVSVVACSESTSNYEDKFIGNWGCISGNKSIMYFFEKDDNGNYTAMCATTVGGDHNMYAFDKYTASSKVITLYQDGTATKYNYSFEDEYLYLDGLEFEKVD